jgi:hypothetical protein
MSRRTEEVSCHRICADLYRANITLSIAPVPRKKEGRAARLAALMAADEQAATDNASPNTATPDDQSEDILDAKASGHKSPVEGSDPQ